MPDTADVLDWLRRRHAGSPADAAEHLGVDRQETFRLLDALVDSGLAERLRPIGHDDSRYDYYRAISRGTSVRNWRNPRIVAELSAGINSG